MHAGQKQSLSGLEGTAPGGKGPGIEPFMRQAPRQPPPSSSSSNGSGGGFQLGAASKQPAAAGSSAGSAGALCKLIDSQFTQLLPWSSDQLAQAAQAAARSGGDSSSRGNAFSNFLTITYAKYQGAAGRTVGIAPGEAWRVALRSALAAGASQVGHLQLAGCGGKAAILPCNSSNTATW